MNTDRWHVVSYPGARVHTGAIEKRAADRTASAISEARPSRQVHGKQCTGERCRWCSDFTNQERTVSAHVAGVEDVARDIRSGKLAVAGPTRRVATVTMLGERVELWSDGTTVRR